MIEIEDKLFERVRKEYESNRDKNFTTSHEVHKQWDNQTLGLSAASLALTITLLDKTIDLKSAEWLCLLFSSWIGFCCAIIFTYVTFYIAAKGSEISKELSEKTYNHHASQHNKIVFLHGQVERKQKEGIERKKIEELINSTRDKIESTEKDFKKEVQPLWRDVEKNSAFTRGFNIAKSIAFVLSFVSLTAFAIINIQHMAG